MSFKSLCSHKFQLGLAISIISMVLLILGGHLLKNHQIWQKYGYADKNNSVTKIVPSQHLRTHIVRNELQIDAFSDLVAMAMGVYSQVSPKIWPILRMILRAWDFGYTEIYGFCIRSRIYSLFQPYYMNV